MRVQTIAAAGVAVALAAAVTGFPGRPASAGEGPVIHPMDDLKPRVIGDKAGDKLKTESVDGKVGKAVRFSFADACQGVFCDAKIRGNPEWDKAAGFSFWVKGDGSKRLGGIQFIWNDDYSARYDYAFPIDGTEWKKITVAWKDLTPVLPGGKFLDPTTGAAPSKISAVWFGKWWYWRDYGAHSYAIDEIRLEPTIETDTADHKPAGNPLERVSAKLKAGKPITVVTMGDSLTDYAHWANKPVNWPTEFVKKAKAAGGSVVTVENPAIGGTQLRQGLVLMPRWLDKVPEPDLVVVCYGGNDWEAGMRGEAFAETFRVTVDRIRRATGGKSDVLLVTTVPSAEQWTVRAELGEAVRKVAAEKNAGLADVERAFHAAAKTEADRPSLFCRDRVHLGPAGHELFADTVLRAITGVK
jgi:lysophospholipase L1-like esterase